MKILKRILAILGILILLLILAAILLPIMFKGKIVQYAKTEANKHINARLDFDNDISLSLFRSFPDFSIGINKILIINNKPFDGDTLVSIPEFHATLDIMSVIKGDRIGVKTLILNKPVINLKVLKDGRSNWDIALKSNEQLKKEGKDTTSNFKMALKRYELNDARIIYDDSSTKFYMRLDNFTHNGKGDFTADDFDLDTKSKADATTMVYDGTTYLSRVKTLLDAKLHINMPKFHFDFKENSLTLNALNVGFDGFWEWPGKDMNMDISFKAKQTDFKNLISLIPALYSHDFDNLKTSGKMAFDGYVKGAYGDSIFPGFALNLNVDNGMFQYPDLPAPVTGVYVDAHVKSPGGDLNNTEVSVPRADFVMAGDPFTVRLVMKTPVKSPWIDGSLKGRINLANLQKVVKLEKGTTMAGILNADVSASGYLSSAQHGQYEKMAAKGFVAGENIQYASKDLAEPVAIASTRLDFTPSDVKLSTTTVQLGKSDVTVSGALHNVLSYALKDQLLSGSMSLSSNFFDVNPWMKSSEGGETKKEEEPSKPVELPANIDFSLSANMKQVVYENMTLGNVAGTIIIRDKKLTFENCAMNTLGGSIKINGYYDSKVPMQPSTEMALVINNLSIPETFRTFATVQQFAPIAKYMTGNVSANLTLKTPLDKQMKPVWNSFYSEGVLDIPKASIENYPPMVMLADKLGQEKLKKADVFNIHPSYVISEGRFRLKKPLDFSLLNIKGQVTGSSGLDKTLDYNVGMDLPNELVKNQVTSAIGDLFKKNNLPMPVAKTVKVNALIGGTADHPTVTLSLKEFAQNTAENIKETAKNIVNQKITEVKKDLSKEIEAKKTAILNAAQQKADLIKQQGKQAADKIRQEGNNQASNMEKQATNPLTKAATKMAADKVRQEAENKARQAENEANNQANQIMNEARNQAAQIK